MTPILDALSDICKKYPLREKILITPDYRLGREVLQAISKAGMPWMNFRMATASSLASEVAEKLIITSGLKRVSGAGIMAIVEDIFYDLADTGKLEYFIKHETNSGIINALTGVIMELRTKGIPPSAIKDTYLAKPEKATDIKIVFSEYERVLKKKGLMDKAGLTRLAIEGLKEFPKNKEKKYVIFSRYYMSGLEREFIEGLAGGAIEVIDDGPVFGVKAPKGFWTPDLSPENIKKLSSASVLSRVYAPEKADKTLKDGVLDLFTARGFREELKEVFRRIVLPGNLLDEAEIVYTDSVTYRREIMFLAEKLGVPVTFSEGVPASVTAPFRAVTGFLNWMKHDFQEIYLRRVLGSGDMNISGSGNADNASGAVLGHLLKVSGVGWSRERYSKVLKKQEEECLRKAERTADDEDAGEREWYIQKAGQIRNVREMCEGLLSLVPETDDLDTVSLEDVCSAVANFLERYAISRSPDDTAFIAEALKRTAVIGELGRGRMPLKEAADKLMGTFFTVNVGPSDPRPGHIHVSHYKHGGRSARPNTFIVGLDEMRFPGRRLEDPILLDSERARISADLEVSSDNARKNIYDMASLLSALRGKVTASFSMYNIREERNVFPSSLMLQLFRLKIADPEADYDNLIRNIGKIAISEKDTCGQTALDDTELWIRKLSDKGVLKDGEAAVKNVYPWISEGLKAERERDREQLTEYDGNLNIMGNELDPREPGSLVLSCSKLEKAATCPFKYFLSNVLGVEKPEETPRDVTLWLTPPQKGSLLHEVFEKFTMESRKRGHGLSSLEEEALAAEILLSAVERYREEIPPPNDMVYLSEFSRMQTDVEVFLLTNRKLGTLPVHEELEFGTGGRPPVQIPLTDGRHFLLRGIIDRLDKVGEHEYHVWDYKTGSAYKYERRKYLAGGEQLQHALYASAAETILKMIKEDENPRVTRSGYILASEKGSGDGKGTIFARDPSRKTLWQGALETLFNIISAGAFMVARGKSCSFCEYDIICDSKKAKERWAKKLSSEDPVIDLWKRLKKYE